MTLDDVVAEERRKGSDATEQRICSGSSSYLGVSRNRKGWEAFIHVAGSKKHLGSYATEEEAAR